MAPALALLDLTVALVGLGIGVELVSRTVELALFAAASLAAVASLGMWVFRPYLWIPTAVALLGLLLALAVAAVEPDLRGERLEFRQAELRLQSAQSTVTLSAADRASLERDVRRLERDGHPTLAAALSGLLGAGGGVGVGVLAQTASTLQRGGETGLRAAGTLMSAATRSQARFSMTNTVHVDSPTVKLGGIHLHVAERAAAGSQAPLIQLESLATLRVRLRQVFEAGERPSDSGHTDETLPETR